MSIFNTIYFYNNNLNIHQITIIYKNDINFFTYALEYNDLKIIYDVISSYQYDNIENFLELYTEVKKHFEIWKKENNEKVYKN
jgi:hypothetical protein